MLFKNDNKNEEKQPDYRVSAKIGDKFEPVGAGWKKTSPKGTQYLSVSLDTDQLEKLYKEKYGNLNSDGSQQPNFDLKTNNDIQAEQVFKDF